LFYYTYDMLSMFRALVRGSLSALNFQPTATQEPDGLCGNQYYSRELLMMGIEVPETCSAYHKYNETRRSI